MEQSSWNKLIDNKLNSQKRLIYSLFALLILSISYIFYLTTLFSDNLEGLESELDKNKSDISLLQSKNQLTEANIVRITSAYVDLRNDQLRCKDAITDINNYLGNLPNNISLISRRNWYDNSYTYYLDIEEYNYFYLSPC